MLFSSKVKSPGPLIMPSNAWFLRLFLAILCSLPVMLAAYIHLKIGTALYIVIGTALISFSFLFLPFVFFKQKTAFLICTLFLLVSPLEIIHLILHKESVGSGFILLLFQTNSQEIGELLMFHKFWTVVYLFTLALYLFICIRYVENRYLLPRKYRYSMLLILLLFLGALYAFSFKSTYDSKNTASENFKKAKAAFALKFRKIYPVNILTASNKAYRFYRDISCVNPEIEHFTFNAFKQDSIPYKEIYVLVIGEAARYANFSINGYRRETTPLLAKTDNIISFSDVYSLSNLTSVSLPLLLTRATPQDFSLSSKEKTLVDAFQEAGFSTYWIANQSAGSVFIRNMAQRCNRSYFAIKDFESVDNYDEFLWTFFDEVLSKDEKKQFIVMHTLGSHFRFNLRYPEEFKKFKPDLEGMTDYSLLNKNIKEQLINSYDNSILYTDYFLANTIQKLKEPEAVSFLFYISDHAENLYDDNDYVLHASNTPPPLEVHVTMIIWTSDKYREIYRSKHEAVLCNVDKSLTADVVFYSLLDMANISIPDEKHGNSITNPALKNDSVRYVLNPKKEIIIYK
jgi:glucan phosphoethanolaminetransferase (alkaline phosphatase superfamily)